MNALELRSVFARWTRDPVKGHSQSRSISLDLRPGEWLLVAGSNGIGKSTLVHALAGEVPYASGDIIVHGRRLGHGDPHSRFVLGLQTVFQASKWPEGLSFEDAVDLACLNRPGLRNEQGIVSLAGRFRSASLIDHNGVMSRRAFDLACAVLSVPSVLVLDEVGAVNSNAGSAQTDERRRNMYRFIKEVAPASAVVFTEHKTRVGLDFADKVLWMRGGATSRGGESYTPENANQSYPRLFSAGDHERCREMLGVLPNDPAPVPETDLEEQEPWRHVMNPAIPAKDELLLALRARSGVRTAHPPKEVYQDFEFLNTSRPSGTLSGGQQTVLRWFMLEYAEIGSLDNRLLGHLDNDNETKIKRWTSISEEKASQEDE